jgi:hypothetical protein
MSPSPVDLVGRHGVPMFFLQVSQFTTVSDLSLRRTSISPGDASGWLFPSHQRPCCVLDSRLPQRGSRWSGTGPSSYQSVCAFKRFPCLLPCKSYLHCRSLVKCRRCFVIVGLRLGFMLPAYRPRRAAIRPCLLGDQWGFNLSSPA